MPKFRASSALWLSVILASVWGLQTGCAVGTGTSTDDTYDSEADDAGEVVTTTDSGAKKAADASAPVKRSTQTDSNTDSGSTPTVVPKDAGTTTTIVDSGSTTTSTADAGACSLYAAPNTVAACDACGTKPCQANGCYGGYYCLISTKGCHAKPPSCP